MLRGNELNVYEEAFGATTMEGFPMVYVQSVLYLKCEADEAIQIDDELQRSRKNSIENQPIPSQSVQMMMLPIQLFGGTASSNPRLPFGSLINPNCCSRSCQ